MTPVRFLHTIVRDMRTPLAEAIWPKARRRIIGLLFARPEEEWHLRDIARLTDLAPATVQREVVSLSNAGVLTRRESGNQVLYGADPSCPIFDELKSIAAKTSGVVDVIREALSDFADRVEVGCIFGSMATGTARPDSDIDLLLIGDISLRELVPELRGLESRVGREVNPVTMRAEEFRSRLHDDEPFIRRVIGEPKVFLFGDKDELRRIAGERETAST